MSDPTNTPAPESQPDQNTDVPTADPSAEVMPAPDQPAAPDNPVAETQVPDGTVTDATGAPVQASQDSQTQVAVPIDAQDDLTSTDNQVQPTDNGWQDGDPTDQPPQHVDYQPPLTGNFEPAPEEAQSPVAAADSEASDPSTEPAPSADTVSSGGSLVNPPDASTSVADISTDQPQVEVEADSDTQAVQQSDVQPADSQPQNAQTDSATGVPASGNTPTAGGADLGTPDVSSPPPVMVETEDPNVQSFPDQPVTDQDQPAPPVSDSGQGSVSGPGEETSVSVVTGSGDPVLEAIEDATEQEIEAIKTATEQEMSAIEDAGQRRLDEIAREDGGSQ